MVGPRISFSLAGTRIAFGVIDLVLAAMVLVGVLHERLRPTGNLIWIVPVGILLLLFCLGVNLLTERLRARITRAGAPALTTIVTLPVAYDPTVAEARSAARSARGGAAGMGIDLAIGLIAVAVFLLVDGTGQRLFDLVAVAAIAIGGSAGIRFLAAPSLNGGRVLRWMFEFTFDDDESAIRAVRYCGYGVACTLFTAGILLLASEGEGGFWGVGLGAVAIDIGVLATIATRHTFWLQSAEQRTLGDLLEAPHAMVSATSSLDEMISVLSVDGPSAVAVVRDAAGNPSGIMQFRQMRAGVGKGAGNLTIGDVMIPIDALPLVPRETSLLEAAQLLLTSSAPALRYENARGKMVIATQRDLGLPK
jgi:hypothetical protein